MISTTPIPSIFVFLLVSVSFGTGWGSSQDIKPNSKSPFNVGVILDMDTWFGNISWSCISMAVDDFYAAHPNHTTKLVLHLKDSKEDVVSAASAALSLMQNLHVQAIIGPQASTQAKFIVELGNKFQTPIISFSATSSFLSSPRNPFFVQAAVSDSTQAGAVSALMRSFGWTKLIPIVEENEYGMGMIPYLIDALQATGAFIPYCSIISRGADDDQILQELHNLKNMQTHVFVVHASNSLVSRLFLKARETGMKGNGYAWIVTYGLTDLMDSSAIDAIDGVLTIKPYMSKSAVRKDFNNRWSERFRQENPTVEAKIPYPNIFSLWAYDTVWAVAMAADSASLGKSETKLVNVAGNYSINLEQLGPLPNGSSLLNFISGIKFKGVSGELQLVHGQMDSAMKFEIVNIVGGKSKRIGFWTKEHGISGNLEFKTNLKRVIQPGNSMAFPKVLKQETGEKKLRIGVPVKQGGWKAFINNEQNQLTKRNGSGFIIEVFNMVVKLLPYRLDYEYIFFENSNGEMNVSYDEFVYQVYLENLDAVVGDVAITPYRTEHVDFTEPFYKAGMLMVVPIKNGWDEWTFVKPLTTPLWLAIGAFFTYTGFAVWVLEHRSNDYFKGTAVQQLGNTLYFSFSTMVYADREKLMSNSVKVVVVVWLFVVLILRTSYTANLTSMITYQKLHPTATDVQDIVRKGGYIGYGGNYNYFNSLNIDMSMAKKYPSPEAYDEALTKGSSAGDISAMVDEIPFTKYFLAMYCGKYTTVGEVYKTDGFGFVFPKGSRLAYDISREILKFHEHIDEKFVWNKTECSKQDNRAASRLSLYNFLGLFLITGLTSTFALILFIICFLYERWHALPTNNSRRSI